MYLCKCECAKFPIQIFYWFFNVPEVCYIIDFMSVVVFCSIVIAVKCIKPTICRSVGPLVITQMPFTNHMSCITFQKKQNIWSLIQGTITKTKQPLCNHWQLVQHYKQWILLYSWRFSCYSVPIHWLVHGHMTSNNETVSRQMPWAGNIAKAMTSNRKQFTVDRCCTWWLESQCGF